MKVGGQIPWNATPICDTSQIYYLMGLRPVKNVLEVLRGIFLGNVLYAGRIWKGDIMIADIHELEEMDASDIRARRLNAKEV